MKHPIKVLATGAAISFALLATQTSSAQAITAASFDAQAVAQASAAREPLGLRSTATAGLQSIINELGKDIKAGTLPHDFPFDINDFSELKNAKLGLGFEVYTAHPQTLLAGGRPFEQMLMGTGIWNFVVLANNQAVALLELEKVAGKWTVNGVGGAKLAQDVQSASENHAGKNAFRFVRIYQATSDLLEVKDIEGKARYVPLIAARQTLRMAGPASGSALPVGADVLPSIQDAVRSHLAHFTQ